MEALNKTIEQTGRFSGKLGKGLVAGLAGTVAITASQIAEMQITGRSGSDTPAQAAGKVLDLEPAGEEEKSKEENKQKFNQLIHWAYGTAWGTSKGILDSLGIKGWKGTIIQFGAIWATAMIMLPALKVSPPVTRWGAKQIAIDGLHHAVYALAAGYMFDKLEKATT